MGLFDSLEQAVRGASANGPGNATTPGVAFSAVARLVQNFPGGVSGLVKRFEQAGLGGVAQSWIGAGANQTVSPHQLEQAVGSAPIDQVAKEVGTSHDQAAGHIASLLPLVLDHLTPNDQVPGADVASQLGSLISHFSR